MPHSNDDTHDSGPHTGHDHDIDLPLMHDRLDDLWNDDEVTGQQYAGAVLGSLPRRRFLTIGGASILTAAVLAACGSSSATSGGAVETTTTVAPGSNKDVNLLRVASSIELVAVLAYQKALDSGLLTNDTFSNAAEAFQTHHKDHAQLFQNATETAGGEPYSKANPALLVVVGPRLTAVKTEADIIRLAFDLEHTLSATYQNDVGQFDNILFNQKVMSVGGIEARHVALIAPLVGKPTTPDGPFQSTAGAVTAGGL